MIILISPAKSLDFEQHIESKNISQPQFLDDAQPLINNLKKKSKKSLMDLMHISESLALLNKSRYNAYHTPFTRDNAKQAIGVFSGDVYQGLDASSLTSSDLNYAQETLRILSGLYGILRPLDLMQAYRLEMGTKLSYRNKKSLYAYWGEKITANINDDLREEGDFIVNLASNEYAKVVQFKKINSPVYHITFKEYKETKLTFVSFNAKRARGLMSRWLIQNRVNDPKRLFDFNLDRYSFDPNHSEGNNLTFTRTFRKAGS